GTLDVATNNGEDVYLDASSVSATITSASGGNFEHLVIGTASATAQVTDTIDDTTVSLSTSDVPEGTANVTFTATLSSASQGVTTVHTTQGDIVITDGQTTGTLDVATNNGEDVYLDASSVSATITSASGGNFEHLVIGTASTAGPATDTSDETTVSLST